MKRIFIVNPKAGNGKSNNAIKAIKEICESDNLDFDVFYTTMRGDAEACAKYFSNPSNIIYSVGGDGTLNEVVNGIMHGNGILGIIPSGTGNDFVKSIPLSNSEVIECDLGKVNDRYFINVASVGIDANVAENAEIMKQKKIHPKMVYGASIIYSLMKHRNISMDINETKNCNTTLLAICNGKYYGGGIKISPNSNISDGELDIFFVQNLSTIRIMPLLLKLLKGSHLNDPKVIQWKTKKIHIDARELLICNVDGEIIKNDEFDIKLSENKIKILNNDNVKIKQLIKNLK